MSSQPGRLRMMGRGATKRCARCGGGKLFRRWFTMVPDCPRCGLHFEREQGYWTGAVAINTIIVFLAFIVVFVTALVLTAPDIPLVPVLVIVIPVMALGPLIAYPFSKTLWVAIDLAFLAPMAFKGTQGRS